MEGLKLLAQSLAGKHKLVEFKPNSTLNLLDKSSEDRNAVISGTADMIGNEVSLYKNLLLPFMNEYKETVAKLVAEKIGKVDLSMYKVIPLEIPSIIKEYFDKKLISKESKQMELPVGTLVIENPGAAVIRSYLKSETPSIQMFIDELLEGTTDDELISLWDKYFLNISGSNDNLNSLGFKRLERIKELSILFILTDKLKNTVPDSVRIAERTYKNIMNNLYTKLVGDLSKAYNDIEYNAKVKKLVISIKDGVLYVDASLYKKFLEENSVEVLLGMAVYDRPLAIKNFYVNDIVINKNTYINSWEKRVKVMTVAVRNQDINAYKLAYEIALDELYKDMRSEITERISVDLNEAKSIVRLFVQRSSIEDLTEVDETAGAIITDLILSDSNFGLFINYMVGYSKLDSNLTAKEAASFATLDLIVDYFSEQVTVIGG